MNNVYLNITLTIVKNNPVLFFVGINVTKREELTLGICEYVLGNLSGDKVKSKQVKVPKALFQMEVIHTQVSSSEKERIDFALRIYASWLARAILQQIGL